MSCYLDDCQNDIEWLKWLESLLTIAELETTGGGEESAKPHAPYVSPYPPPQVGYPGLIKILPVYPPCWLWIDETA